VRSWDTFNRIFVYAMQHLQLRNDSTRPTGELWRRDVDRGHGGATTRRPSPATSDNDDNVSSAWMRSTSV